MVSTFLFRKVDAAPLALFRILMGILMSCEGFGAILTGWVRENYVDVPFSFNFIGFDFLQAIVGTQAYAIYAALGILGLCIAFGLYFRLAVIAYTLLWAAVYYGQKTSYNNHYYLLLLVCLLFAVSPAGKYASLDAHRGLVKESPTVAYWSKWMFKFLLLIVYVYAAFAKIYPDWLNGTTVRLFLSQKADWPIIGRFVDNIWFIRSISFGGILFDFLVIPALWLKPTRKIAFVVSIFFHLFNSIVFQIGIFPYMMLITSVLFFQEELIRQLFFRKNSVLAYSAGVEVIGSFRKNAIIGFLALFFFIQIILPLRPFYFPGSPHWSEEGHRLSWHMMLRSKTGSVHFIVKNDSDMKEERIFPEREINDKMARAMATRPDIIWQYAQLLKKEYAAKGQTDVAVYVVSKVSLNGHPYAPMIDPKVNLADEPWQPYAHHDWILEEGF